MKIRDEIMGNNVRRIYDVGVAGLHRLLRPLEEIQKITSYDPWFRLNADMAWSQRNAADVVGWQWTAKTGTDALYSWDCSAAVAMMEVLLPARK